MYYPVFTIIFLLFPDSVDGCYGVCSFLLHTPTDRDQKNMKYRTIDTSVADPDPDPYQDPKNVHMDPDLDPRG